MLLRAQFSGPARYRARATAAACRAVAQAILRRELKGPRLPGWNWAVELWTEVLRGNLRIAFAMPEVDEARRYLDAIVFGSPALSQVNITPVADEKIRASWFVPNGTQPDATVLYFHGGGFSFYPGAYAGFIAMIALTAKARTLALDYRLSPEHRFPDQLHDALAAYRWLLDHDAGPGNLVVGGDSAGGNLAIALLLAARDGRMPLPKLAFALSPPTDFEAAAEAESRGTSLAGNEEFDWIDRKMLTKWSEWYCAPGQRRHAYVSPAYADLRGLPPIYIQAGRAEILYDSIARFAAGAKQQGANVVLESWADMNHNFQMFGEQAPQSAEALRRLGEVIDLYAQKT
ncbi:MAG: alpha/beta hydrolase fold domain-containing protein [Candidatus Korobacteraceae bacterium]